MPLYRYVHRENIFADGTMSRMPRKRDLGTGYRSCSVRFLTQTSFAVVCAAFRCLFFIDWAKVSDYISKFKFSRVNLTLLQTISCEEVCEKY